MWVGVLCVGGSNFHSCTCVIGWDYGVLEVLFVQEWNEGREQEEGVRGREVKVGEGEGVRVGTVFSIRCRC